MHNLYDLQEPLGMTFPHVRRFTKIVYPGAKLFTDEQVLHLIEVRERMKAGLSWKEMEEKYGSKNRLQVMRLLEDSYREKSSPPQETKLEDEQVSPAPIQHITINIYPH